MKSITRLVGIAALAFSPAIVPAQDAIRSVSFGVSGGASVPVRDLGDVAETGFNLGAHILLMPTSLKNVSFRGDVSFDRWDFSGVGAQAVDAQQRALGVMANIIFKSASAMSIKPYAIAGLGLINSKVSGTVGNVTYSGDSKSNLGLQAGGGLEFQLSGFTTFLEAKVVNAFTENKATNWIPITFGVRF